MKDVAYTIWVIIGIFVVAYFLANVLWEPFANWSCISQAPKYGFSANEVRMPKFQTCEVFTDDGRWVGFGTWVEYWDAKPIE